MSERWILEMLDSEGNTTGHLFSDQQALGDFVRVNAMDAEQFRILKTTDDAITQQLWKQIDADFAEAVRV